MRAIGIIGTKTSFVDRSVPPSVGLITVIAKTFPIHATGKTSWPLNTSRENVVKVTADAHAAAAILSLNSDVI
jgi:hypothetical protein